MNTQTANPQDSLQRLVSGTELEPRSCSERAPVRSGVGGLRKRDSARFAPYYKAQRYDDKQLAWRDVQKQFATPEEARAAFGKGKWRVMEITMNGRNPL